MRVLVVESDPGLASLVADCLGDDGHEVVAVPDRRAALALAVPGGWDVCLCDGFARSAVGPTEGDRADLAALHASAPVVLYSVHPWVKTVGAGGLGVAAVMGKPFDLDELTGALEEAARRP